MRYTYVITSLSKLLRYYSVVEMDVSLCAWSSSLLFFVRHREPDFTKRNDTPAFFATLHSLERSKTELRIVAEIISNTLLIDECVLLSSSFFYIEFTLKAGVKWLRSSHMLLSDQRRIMLKSRNIRLLYIYIFICFYILITMRLMILCTVLWSSNSFTTWTFHILFLFIIVQVYL